MTDTQTSEWVNRAISKDAVRLPLLISRLPSSTDDIFDV